MSSNLATHYLDDSQPQPFWDNSIEPRLVIDPGDTVVFECLEASGQYNKHSTLNDYLNVDRSQVHALTGSVYINGAEPGDALKIHILDMQHKGWGWTAFRPGFGLLASDFTEPYFHVWELEGERCHFGIRDIVLPFEPMPGCVGVAPRESGRLNTLPPRQNGGNVDVRDLTVGSVFWLPVLSKGALFATGDCHANQGQGEICGTGIEAPMTVTLRIELEKHSTVKELQYQRPSPMTKTDRGGHFGTTAHGPDLYINSQNAVRQMIEWLVREQGLTANQAYCLCGAIVDLKISEIVDEPNWIVSAQIPLEIFRS